MDNWYQLEANAVLDRFSTDANNSLSNQDVEKWLYRFPSKQLPEHQSP
jgi:hypothetical protein